MTALKTICKILYVLTHSFSLNCLLFFIIRGPANKQNNKYKVNMTRIGIGLSVKSLDFVR